MFALPPSSYVPRNPSNVTHHTDVSLGKYFLFHLRVYNIKLEDTTIIRVVLTPRNGWMRTGCAVDAQRMHSGRALQLLWLSKNRQVCQ